MLSFPASHPFNNLTGSQGDLIQIRPHGSIRLSSGQRMASPATVAIPHLAARFGIARHRRCRRSFDHRRRINGSGRTACQQPHQQQAEGETCPTPRQNLLHRMLFARHVSPSRTRANPVSRSLEPIPTLDVHPILMEPEAREPTSTVAPKSPRSFLIVAGHPSPLRGPS